MYDITAGYSTWAGTVGSIFTMCGMYLDPPPTRGHVKSPYLLKSGFFGPRVYDITAGYDTWAGDMGSILQLCVVDFYPPSYRGSCHKSFYTVVEFIYFDI